jgi:hypothetical protein
MKTRRDMARNLRRWGAFQQLSAIKEALCFKGRSIMKRQLTALVLAGSLATAAMATPTPAHARWGEGWGLGAFALGAFVGAALARPAYAYYPAYSYGYAYPAYSYGYGGYYGGYRPYYRPALYGGYRVARRVAIHRARWR